MYHGGFLETGSLLTVEDVHASLDQYDTPRFSGKVNMADWTIFPGRFVDGNELIAHEHVVGRHIE